jgi:hypothetical protein
MYVMMQFDVGGIIWGLPLKIENVILEISNWLGFWHFHVRKWGGFIAFHLNFVWFFFVISLVIVDIVDFICL